MHTARSAGVLQGTQVPSRPRSMCVSGTELGAWSKAGTKNDRLAAWRLHIARLRSLPPLAAAPRLHRGERYTLLTGCETREAKRGAD